MPKLAFLLLGLALVLFPARAQGSGRRVALLERDPELQRALAVALAAWDVETLPLEARISEESEPEARAQAAELARSLHLEGLVWVSLTLEGSRLAIFDAHTGELTLRSLSERPPFASTTAASLALSVKTALRPSVAASSAPPPPSRPAPRAPAQRSARSASAHVGVGSADADAAALRERLSLRATLALGWIAEKKAQSRGAAAAMVWLGPRRQLGAALRVSGGAGVDVDTPTLSARYRDLALGVGGEWRWLEAGALSSGVGLGATLHRATFDGSSSDDRSIAITRYNTSLDANFRVDVRVARGLFVGLDVASCFFVDYQRFLVLGQSVFAPFRLSPSAGVSLGIAPF